MISPTTAPNIIEQHYSAEFNAVGRTDQIEIISLLLLKIIRDLGKKITDDDLEYIMKSIINTLNRRYRMWRVSDIMQAFENGKIGNYGASYSITVANIESWLYQHHTNEVNPRIVRENIKTQAEKSRTTSSMMEGMNVHSEYADVLLWRLSFTDAIRPKSKRTTILPQEYIEQKTKIWSIPRDEVAEALRNKTIRQMLDKHGIQNS